PYGDPHDLPSFPTRRSSDLEKLADLQAQARVYAETTAVELQQARGSDAIADLVARKLSAGARNHPGMSMALIPIGPRPTFSGLQDRKSTRLNSSHVKISYAV